MVRVIDQSKHPTVGEVAEARHRWLARHNPPQANGLTALSPGQRPGVSGTNKSAG